MLAKMTCMVMLAVILLFSPSKGAEAKPTCPKGYCKGSIAHCLPNAEDACGVYDGCATGLSQSSDVVIKLELNIASVEDCNAMCLNSLADNGEECYFFSYSYGRSVSTSNRGQCRIHRKPMDGLDLRPDHWPSFISCPVTPYPAATTTAAPDSTTTPWTSTWTVVPGEGVCDSGYLDGVDRQPQEDCQEGCEANDQCKFYCYGTGSKAFNCLRYSKCDGKQTTVTQYNIDVKDYTCFEKPQAPTKEPTTEPPIQALCPQYGADNSKCHTSDTNEIGVHMQKDCQAAAVAAGHKFYSWNENDELCATSASCDVANLGHEWKIYSCESTTTEPPTTTKATTTEPPVCDEPGLQKCYADLVFGSTGANAVGGTAMCDLVDATTTCIREKIVGCATSVVEQYDALMKPVTDLACKDQGDCVAHPVCTGEILTTTTAKPTACEPWCVGNSHAWSKTLNNHHCKWLPC